MFDAGPIRSKITVMILPPSKTLREGCVEGHLTDDCIVWLKFDQGASVTFEDSQASYRMVADLTHADTPHCTIVDIRGVRKSSAKARRNNIHSKARAMAILIASPVSRMLANAYLLVRRPEIPMRLFTCKDEARKWALAQLSQGRADT
jgi:hypothetical protein